MYPTSYRRCLFADVRTVLVNFKTRTFQGERTYRCHRPFSPLDIRCILSTPPFEEDGGISLHLSVVLSAPTNFATFTPIYFTVRTVYTDLHQCAPNTTCKVKCPRSRSFLPQKRGGLCFTNTSVLVLLEVSVVDRFSNTLPTCQIFGYIVKNSSYYRIFVSLGT